MIKNMTGMALLALLSGASLDAGEPPRALWPSLTSLSRGIFSLEMTWVSAGEWLEFDANLMGDYDLTGHGPDEPGGDLPSKKWHSFAWIAKIDAQHCRTVPVCRRSRYFDGTELREVDRKHLKPIESRFIAAWEALPRCPSDSVMPVSDSTWAEEDDDIDFNFGDYDRNPEVKLWARPWARTIRGCDAHPGSAYQEPGPDCVTVESVERTRMATDHHAVVMYEENEADAGTTLEVRHWNGPPRETARPTESESGAGSGVERERAEAPRRSQSQMCARTPMRGGRRWRCDVPVARDGDRSPPWRANGGAAIR